MEELLRRVRHAFSATFDVDPSLVNIDTGPKNVPAWDSMGHVALASELEREFGLTFSVDELMEMENVREIVRIVESKLVIS